MTGEVKLLERMRINYVSFKDLVVGQGIINTDGVRIKIREDRYLHFLDGKISSNDKGNWPCKPIGEIKKFHLIAKEI